MVHTVVKQDKQKEAAITRANKQKEAAITRAKSLCFVKRKECVKKKTRELSILCDIKACVVVLGPNGQVDTWPENPDNVREIIGMYRDFTASNPCKKKKKVFEPSVKVEKGDDNVPEIIHEDLGTKKGCRKQEEAWDESLSKAYVQDFLRKIESKLETLEERTDFLKKRTDCSNGSKGKEVAVLDEEAELNGKYYAELWNLLEGEASDSQDSKIPQLEAISEQSIPSLETMSGQNLFENPQFCNSWGNSEMGFLEGTITDHEIIQNIPLNSNFNSPPSYHHGIHFPQEISSLEKQNIQFPNQSLWFDASAYGSRMLDVMPPGLYPQVQDFMDFSGGTFMQPAVLTPCWFDECAADATIADQTIFASLPQLCPLPQPQQQQQQAFGPDCYPWQPLIYQPSSSSSFQHHNMQYQGF